MTEFQSTPLFTVASNLTTASLPKEIHHEFRWIFEPALNEPEKEAPKLPPLPALEDLGTHLKTMVKFVKEAAELGRHEAARLNHDPFAPHLPHSARPGASVFQATTPEDVISGINSEKAVVTSLTGGPGVRIFTLNCGEVIGVNKTSSLILDQKYTLVKEHGTLMPMGPVNEWEDPTRIITFVFTWEGPSHGWVLASAHPGNPDPTPNLEGLVEGETYEGTYLWDHGFSRAIPQKKPNE